MVAGPRFEPAIRQVSEFRRTIGGNIAGLRRVGKSGSPLPLPKTLTSQQFVALAQKLPYRIFSLVRGKPPAPSGAGATRQVACQVAERGKALAMMRRGCRRG